MKDRKKKKKRKEKKRKERKGKVIEKRKILAFGERRPRRSSSSNSNDRKELPLRENPIAMILNKKRKKKKEGKKGRKKNGVVSQKSNPISKNQEVFFQHPQLSHILAPDARRKS